MYKRTTLHSSNYLFAFTRIIKSRNLGEIVIYNEFGIDDRKRFLSTV